MSAIATVGSSMMSWRTSPRSRLFALLLAFFFGVFGVHRFYVGKFWTGLLLLATGGGFGIWWIVDCFMILFGHFRDADDRIVRDW